MIDLIPGSRIDNRDELADRLSIPRASAAAMDTTELVLASYHRWGKDCPGYLLGDFAFAIRDGQRWFLARDHLGIRPLYYSQAGGSLAYSGDIHQLLRQPQISARISRQAVLSYLLTGGIHERELTIYDQVRKLPPGHSLTVEGSDSHLKRYWNPDKPAHLDEFRDLLTDAVRVRLPQEGPIATHLSGGIDSSAITALAALQLADRSRLQAYTWMRPPITAEETRNPEWGVALAVADKYRLPLQHTPFKQQDFDRIIDHPPLQDNDTADLWYEFSLRESVRKQGGAVILSGWGGDQFISNAGEGAHLEALFSRRALASLSDLVMTARSSHRPIRAARSLFRHQLVAPLAGYLRWRYHRASCGGIDLGRLPLATREFQQWADREGALPVAVRPSLRLRGQQMEELSRGTYLNRVEAWAAAGNRAGVEYRYPLLDKRIVEFALALPPLQYRGGGMTRRIFWEAVSDLFPEVLRRGGGIKYEPRRVQEAYDILAASLRRRLSDFVVTAGPFIDGKKLQQAAARLPAPGTPVTEYSMNCLVQVQRALMVALLSGDLSQN